MNYKMTKYVSREVKPMAVALRRVMMVFTILFLLMGIVFDRGMLLLAMLMVVLYWIFSSESVRDYEYQLEDEILTIDVIKGKQRRKTVHELELKGLEVLAPSWHEAVARYRKDGGVEHLKKYDYTSYDDEIPYYTMIIHVDRYSKIKLLLDLDMEWLMVLKRKYPEKVYIE